MRSTPILKYHHCKVQYGIDSPVCSLSAVHHKQVNNISCSALYKQEQDMDTYIVIKNSLIVIQLITKSELMIIRACSTFCDVLIS